MSTGGILRDSLGSWVGGFSSKEGMGSVLESELLAVQRGLHFAWERGATHVICETDSIEVFLLIQSDSSFCCSRLSDTPRDQATPSWKLEH
ncbi:Ribonuclease H-like superfamily [Sesbania bispinosa]|nr:Ribonuclease H-like superfamily [Sesbania bispinosa]